MRISAKDPQLISSLGDFMKVYLPCVRNRDDDTIASYRYSINLFMSYLNSARGLLLFVKFCEGRIVTINAGENAA